MPARSKTDPSPQPKVYIAAPYPIRISAIALKEHLERRGVTVTSRWLISDGVESDEFAEEDLEDVRAADVLIAFNPPDWAQLGTGGRHVEFGYALALGKPIVLFGVRSNIFHHLSRVRLAADVEDLIAAVGGLHPVLDDRAVLIGMAVEALEGIVDFPGHHMCQHCRDLVDTALCHLERATATGAPAEAQR
jgi:nucleoside 2-deoxyribosyltransferase